MNTLSQDTLCPCGSGKTYKHCCKGKILPFPKKGHFEGDGLKTAAEMVEMIKENLGHQEFHSLEELNRELRRFSHNQNSLPKAPFLGLSPTQMHIILYHPFNLRNEIFNFEDSEMFTNIPLMTQALYFLDKLKEVGQLRATQKGNLPQAFVLDFYQHFGNKQRYSHVPKKEDDFPLCKRLRYLLNMGGFIKKRANKFSLTKKGEKMLREENRVYLFYELTHTFFNKFNWSCIDGYPDLPLIQSSAIFNLYLLNKRAQDWIEDKELGEIYLHAFPGLIHEVYNPYDSPDKTIINCFSFRFLQTVCHLMGFLEQREEGKGFDRKFSYKVSPFFKRSLKFVL